MEDLVIFGAGGLGREMLFQLGEENKLTPKYNILGFVDDGHSTGELVDDYPVLGGCDYLLTRNEKTNVIIAIGNPRVRRLIHEKLSANRNLVYPTVIAPNVICSDRVRFGEGCIVGFGSVLTVDIEIGDFVLISNSCNIGHDAVLSDYVTLYPAAHISGNVHLEQEVQMGVGSNIIQGLSVGEGSFVGAGATVVRSIPAHCTAVGVPAKVIRYHDQKI